MTRKSPESILNRVNSTQTARANRRAQSQYRACAGTSARRLALSPGLLMEREGRLNPARLTYDFPGSETRLLEGKNSEVVLLVELSAFEDLEQKSLRPRAAGIALRGKAHSSVLFMLP